MAECISILGSTGSVGTQALDVLRSLGNIRVSGLAAKSNIELLEKQAREFKPAVVAVLEEEKAKELKARMEDTFIKVVSGEEGMVEAATVKDADMVLTSVTGIAGLVPTIEAINSGKDIALANKETLVAAGEIVIREARERGVNIIPVDSEHSAVFQCLNTCKYPEQVKKIILTASGGPFRGRKAEELVNITSSEALRHPCWNMGRKVTIDAATLMNKGFEVIEARWLFNMDVDKIDVIIHPQSVVHSMVEFIDGSIIAQLGITDMRIPIQYALTYPARLHSGLDGLSLAGTGVLEFEEPDYETFGCLHLAYRAACTGGTAPAALNAADETAVELFLQDKIKFTDIPRIIGGVLNKHKNTYNPRLSDILKTDKHTRKVVSGLVEDGEYIGFC